MFERISRMFNHKVTTPEFELAPLLTPREVALILGVHIKTLAAWRRTKRLGLPFAKVGRLVRYKAADVAAFIEAQTRQGGAA